MFGLKAHYRRETEHFISISYFGSPGAVLALPELAMCAS